MTPRIGLVGAGYISAVHAQALAACGLQVAAVIDPNLGAAERLAKQYGARSFASVAEAKGQIDRAHILVPPDLHFRVTREVLELALPVLVEKPLTTTSAEARELVSLADQKGVCMGVNQNFMFHPALLRFLGDYDAGHYGRIHHVSINCLVPLRQLDGNQFSHWMFRAPANIILEQLVHPLSQITRLLGQFTVESATAATAAEVAPGLMFHKSFDVNLSSATATAQLHMSFGANYPVWQIIIACDDGVACVDVVNNVYTPRLRTRWMPEADSAIWGARAGLATMSRSLGNLTAYARSLVGLGSRADAFYLGIKGCVADFHGAVDRGVAPVASASVGVDLIAACEQIATLGGVSAESAKPVAQFGMSGPPKEALSDVVLFGGTGFIGRHVLRALLAADFTVTAVARNNVGLPSTFADPRVRLVKGDVTRRDDLEASCGLGRIVVNLAHGGASGSREAIITAMVGSARELGEIALAKRVERLIHIGSIAGLYLGDPNAVITPHTSPDDHGAERGDYAHAKAEADRVLLNLHQTKGLPVVILRPGVVVGSGASPLHSGLGIFNNSQHCLGWNGGDNPLPFILVEDVASAVVATIKADSKVHGTAHNLVGDVQMSAREYCAELRRCLHRPIVFHPLPVWRQQLVEIGKWIIKRIGGRAVPFPSTRDLRSRGMMARFDTSETKRLLHWRPESDRARFIRDGIDAAANR